MISATTPVSQLLNRLRMRQIALLLAIEQRGTLGKAARELGMTQPAATKMLHELESALGAPLFARVGRTIQINQAGRQALLSFKGLQGTLEQLQRELQQVKAGKLGRIGIGSIMAASPTYLTRALAELKAQNPRLDISVHVGTNDRLMTQLDEGELDVVIGRVPGSVENYRFRPLAEEAVSIICASDHPLSASCAPGFGHISKYPWVLQPEGTPLRELIANEFAAHHAALAEGLLETSSTLITIHLVTRSQLLAVLPTSVAKGFARHGMLNTLRYRMRNQLATYGSIVRTDRPLAAQAAHFLQLLHQRTRLDW